MLREDLGSLSQGCVEHGGKYGGISDEPRPTDNSLIDFWGRPALHHPRGRGSHAESFLRFQITINKPTKVYLGYFKGFLLLDGTGFSSIAGIDRNFK